MTDQLRAAAAAIEPTASQTLVEEFKAGLRGELLFPVSAGYEAALKIHNGMINNRPAMVARCAGVADVINCVNFARTTETLVSIRGGGHGVPGFAICDGGLMIDLSRLKGIRVDPDKRSVRAEGGVNWGEFYHETQAFGLATTGGVARPTGIAGLTLAGGHGYLMRKYGLACDNLRSVDIVTADGRFLTASATQHPDLFWGLRGGGGNFGVVTSFEYQLHPVGPVLGGLVFYPMKEAQGLLKFYHEFTGSAPDEVSPVAVLATLPDGTKAVVIILGYFGPPDQGERTLRPLRTFSTPLSDQVGPMTYVELQSIVEKFNPPGLRNYWKTCFLKELSDEAISIMVDHYASVPSPYSHVVVYTLGGAVSRVGKEETAVAHRDARQALVMIGMWSDSADDDRNIRWVRELSNAMEPYSSGGFYINYEAAVSAEQVRGAYGPETYERLVALKNKYDPTNFFRLNQNIKPTV